MRSLMLLSGLLFVVGPLSVQASEDAPTPKKIAAADARQHVGEQVAATLEVRAAKNSMKHKKIFLDSETDFQEEKNLGISISEQGADDLRRQRNIADAAEHYRGKTICVTGTVVEREGRVYIDVHEAQQIELVEAP